MVFADAQTCSLAWIALAGTAVTTVGTVVVAYLTLRANSRATALEIRADTSDKAHAKCEKELDAAKTEAKARDDSDRAALERRMDALDAQVAAKKDETKEHKPV